MQNHLKPLLSFVSSIYSEMDVLRNLLASFDSDNSALPALAVSCRTVVQLLAKGIEIYYAMFNHILRDLFAIASAIEQQARMIALSCAYLDNASPNLASAVVNLQTPAGHTVNEQICRLAKKHKVLYERQLLWSVKVARTGQNQQAMGPAFDYFVRREVTRKMKEEEKDPDEQIFFVPFTIKQQIPLVVGKAMDEWTKEDVAKMEAEAEKAIEQNFPSYYDEVQKTFFESDY